MSSAGGCGQVVDCEGPGIFSKSQTFQSGEVLQQEKEELAEVKSTVHYCTVTMGVGVGVLAVAQCYRHMQRAGRRSDSRAHSVN